MIGVFDSGFGGLTVLKELLKKLPQYEYLYLGDNARAPYGEHSPEAILQFSREAVDFLFGKGCRLILVACNTVSAVALRTLQEDYLRAPEVMDKKILGVIFPLAEKVAEISKTGRVGVVGTRATVDSEAYVHEFKKLRPNLKIHQKACPLLVPLIEEGWQDKPEARMILKKYLISLKTCNLDTLILGCTHYPLMQRDFARIMGKNINVLNTGATVAESLMDYLARHPEIEKLLKKGVKGKEKRLYFTTGETERFQKLGARFLGQAMHKVEKICL
jgi:glutamate racemase